MRWWRPCYWRPVAGRIRHIAWYSAWYTARLGVSARVARLISATAQRVGLEQSEQRLRLRGGTIGRGTRGLVRVRVRANPNPNLALALTLARAPAACAARCQRSSDARAPAASPLHPGCG